ncbi:hypothetical protein ScPMuIL_000304 [Solemya velum]
MAENSSWASEHFVDRVEQKLESPEKEQITQNDGITLAGDKSRSSSSSIGGENTTDIVSNIPMNDGHGNDDTFVDRFEEQLVLDCPEKCMKRDTKQHSPKSHGDLDHKNNSIVNVVSTQTSSVTSLQAVDHVEEKLEGNKLDTVEKVKSDNVNDSWSERSVMGKNEDICDSTQTSKTMEQGVSASTVDGHILRLQALGEDIDSPNSENFVGKTFKILHSPDRDILPERVEDDKNMAKVETDSNLKYHSSQTESSDKTLIVCERGRGREPSPFSKIDIQAHIASQQELGSQLDPEKIKQEQQNRIQKQLEQQEQKERQITYDVQHGQALESILPGSSDLEAGSKTQLLQGIDYSVDNTTVPRVNTEGIPQNGHSRVESYGSMEMKENVSYKNELRKHVETPPENSAKLGTLMQDKPIEIRQERNIEVEKLYECLQKQETEFNVDEKLMTQTEMGMRETQQEMITQLGDTQNKTSLQGAPPRNVENKETDYKSDVIKQEHKNLHDMKSDNVTSQGVSMQTQGNLIQPVKKIEIERKFKVPKNSHVKFAAIGADLIIEKTFTDVYYDNLNYSLTLQNCWFRNRNSVWELKVPVLTGEKLLFSTQYREITDTKEIIEYLSAVIPDGRQSKVKPMQDVLVDLGLVAFATITTTRQTYALPHCTIDVDLTDFGFSVGEIEVMVSSENRIPEALRTIETVAAELGFELPCIYSV